MSATLAQEARNALDAKRAAHREAKATADEIRDEARKRAATDPEYRAKILDVDTPEFKAIDDAYRPVSAIAEDVEKLEAAWQRHVEIEGESAAATAVASFAAGDRSGIAEVAARIGVPLPLVERAAAAVVEDDAWKALVESGAFAREGGVKGRNPLHTQAIMERREFKALVTGASGTSGGAFVENDRTGEVVGLPVRPLTVLDLIAVGQTDSDTVEFVRQTSRASAAAIVAEATTTSNGAKPESGIAWEVVTTAVKTLAHWTPATRRALQDAGQVASMIEEGLEYGLLELLESQVIGGDGTGENFTGLTIASGIGAYARDTGAGESRLDAIHKGITLVRVQNIEPTTIGLHPEDWQDVRLEKDDNGAYMLGPANDAAPMRLFGVGVHTSTGYTSGTGLVGDYRRAASLWIRSAPEVFIADQHSDFFIRNILVMLCELRAAFGVRQPKALAKVTSL